MISVTPELAALFDSGAPLQMCDLYTIGLAGGGVLRYTDNDLPITYQSQTWGIGPKLSRSEVRTTVGIDVDDLPVTLAAEDSVLINGVPLMAFVSRGGLDNGRILVERAFRGVGDADLAGKIYVFSGRIAEVSGNRFEKELVIKGDTEVLNVMVPRDVYQPHCRNTLFDGPCGLNRAAWGVPGSATAAGDALGMTIPHGLSEAAGWFDRGRVTMTSGPNSGITRSVRRHTTGIIELLQPLPYPITLGATFLAYPGCDRRVETCGTKFSNRLRFRAEPWIPTPETVV